MKENWEDMARAYDKFISHPESFSSCIEMPAVLSMVPNLEGSTVLDLGCGTGRFANEFAKLKASNVIGIDLSESMIEMANGTNDSNVTFKVGDVTDLSEFDKESFDFIFSSTVFHFVEDLDSLFHKIYNMLKPGGEAIFSLIHPVHSAKYPKEKQNGELPTPEEWQVRYLDKTMRAYVQPWIALNPNIEDYLCRSYHHTLEDYMKYALKTGFVLDDICEPMPPKEWKEKAPRKYYAYLKTPNYLVMKWKKNK